MTTAPQASRATRLGVAAAAAAIAMTGCSNGSNGSSSDDDAYCAEAKKLTALSDKVDPGDRQAGLEVAKQFEILRAGAPDEIRDDFDVVEEFFRTQRDQAAYDAAAKHITDYTKDSCDVEVLKDNGPFP